MLYLFDKLGNRIKLVITDMMDIVKIHVLRSDRKAFKSYICHLLLMWSWPGYILKPQILHLKNGNYCSTSLWDYSENLVTYVKLLTCCRHSIMETHFSCIVTNPQAVWHLLIFDFFLTVRIRHKEKSALRWGIFILQRIRYNQVCHHRTKI